MKRKKQTPQAGKEPSFTQKRAQRRKKVRRRFFLRLFILLVIAALAAVVWFNWDTLAPEKLYGKLRDSMNDSAGQFPVDLNGTEVLMLVRSQGRNVLLEKDNVVYFNDAGNEAARYPNPYSKPLMHAEGNFLLLAEQGGHRAQLMNRFGVVRELETEQNILAASVNKKGQCALLTEGPQGYSVEVVVFDKRGNKLYSRARGRLAMDVALSADGKQVALLSAQAENGTLNTVMEVFSVKSASNEAMYTYTAADSLLYGLHYLSGGQLVAEGEDRVLLVDAKSGAMATYALGNQRLLGNAAGHTGVALALRAYGSTGNGQVVVLDENGEERCTVDFTGEFRSLRSDGDRYILLTDCGVQLISAGGATKSAQLAADSQQAILGGKGTVVLGINSLQTYGWE